MFRALMRRLADVFRSLRVPASLPYVVAASRSASRLSAIGAVVAEWMSGDGGVGRSS
jgi:ABC-type nitrate/sulfonate/bicarbonate transport system permease component